VRRKHRHLLCTGTDGAVDKQHRGKPLGWISGFWRGSIAARSRSPPYGHLRPRPVSIPPRTKRDARITMRKLERKPGRKTMRLTARVLIPMLTTLMIAGAGICAQPSTFANEEEAKQHCSADIVVWLNLQTWVYYVKGQPSYGRRKNGAYVCEKEADKNGARADGWNYLSILEENDSLFFNSDKHYTQGFRISLLGPEPATGSWWDDGFRLPGNIPPFFVSTGTPGAPIRSESLFFGQSIFTPKNKAIAPPDPHDRPYAGWLYVGTSLLQEAGLRQKTGVWGLGMLENAELDIGFVGPGAVGKQVQND